MFFIRISIQSVFLWYNFYSMRLVFVIAVLIASVSIKAQTVLPLSFSNYTQHQNFARYNNLTDSTSNKKWFLSKYAGLSTGISFFNGTSASFIAAPVGLQLNRRLNNNLYAFAGVSAAPAYINFNNAFLITDINKKYPGNNFLKSNNFGLSSRAELGLMYINDAGTFSISGSVGIERNNYAMFPTYPFNTSSQNTISQRR